MKQIQPELARLKERHKGDQEKLARETLALYRKYGVSPFSMVVPMLVQLPVIIGLFWVFSKGGMTNGIDATLLYPFVVAPSEVSIWFFGVNLGERSAILAILAGLVQFAQLSFSLPKPTPRDPNQAPSFAEEFQRTFQWQARFLFPLLIGFVAWTLPSAVALYFITSSLFQVLQDWVIRRKVAQEQQATAGAKEAPAAQSAS